MQDDNTPCDIVEVKGYAEKSDMNVNVSENENKNMVEEESVLPLPVSDEDKDGHGIVYEYDSSSGFESGGEEGGFRSVPVPSSSIHSHSHSSPKSNIFKFTGTIPDSESNYSIVTSSSMNLSSVVGDDEERFHENPDQSTMEHHNSNTSNTSHLQNDENHNNINNLTPTSHTADQEIFYEHTFQQTDHQEHHQQQQDEEEEEFWFNTPLRFVSINKVLPFTYAAILHLVYFFAVIELMINRKIQPLFVGIYMGTGYLLKWIMASFTKFAPKTVTLIASLMSIAGFLLLFFFHSNTTYVIIAIIILHGNEVFHALQLFVKSQCQKDLKEMAQHLKNQYFTKTLAPPIIYFMAGLLRYTSTDVKQLAKLGLLLSTVQILFLTLFLLLDHFRPTNNHDRTNHDNISSTKSKQHQHPIETYEENPSSKKYNLLSIITGSIFISHIQKLIFTRKLLLDDFAEIAKVLETYSVQKNYITPDTDEETINGQENESTAHKHCRIPWTSYLCTVQSCVVLLSFQAAPLLFNQEYHICWRDMGFIFASITFTAIILSTIMMILFLWDAQSKNFPLDLYTSGFGISLFTLLTAMPNIITYTIGLAGLYLTSLVFSINLSYFQAIQINSHNIMTNEFWITLHGRHIVSLICVMATPLLYTKLRMLPSLIAFWLAFCCLLTTLLYCECSHHSPVTKDQRRRKRDDGQIDNQNDQHHSENKQKKKKKKRKKLKRLRPPADSNILTPSDIVVLNFLTNGFSHIL